MSEDCLLSALLFLLHVLINLVVAAALFTVFDIARHFFLFLCRLFRGPK